MNKKRNILLIGAGNIGTRHLQGMTRSIFRLQIHVVEPSTDNIAVAKQRYHEMPRADLHAIEFYPSVSLLPHVHYDLVIMATNADIRAYVTEEVVEHYSISHLVLEKVVFQNNLEFDRIGRLLESKNVTGWVNCPMRSFPFYTDLKKKIPPEARVKLTVKGNEWGLACNSIHYIDLLAFLSDCTSYRLTLENLHPKAYPSKRTGFYEFNGHLGGRFSNGSSFELESGIEPNHAIPGREVNVYFAANKRVQIFEAKKIALYYEGNMDKPREEWVFDFPYQSELTGMMNDELLQTNVCRLTPYSESRQLHHPMLEYFLRHYNHISGMDAYVCPIT